MTVVAPETMLKLLWVKSPAKSNVCLAVPLLSVSSPTPATSEKPDKLHEPRRSTASEGAKPEISPQKPLGSERSSVPPPVKPMSCEPTALLVPTVELEFERRGRPRSYRFPARPPCRRSPPPRNRACRRKREPSRCWRLSARSRSFRFRGLFREPGVRRSSRGRRRSEPDPAVVEDVPGRSRGDFEPGGVAGRVAHRRRAAGLDDLVRVVERRRPADRQAEDYGRSLGVQDVRAARRRSGEGVDPVKVRLPPERSSVAPAFPVNAPR